MILARHLTLHFCLRVVIYFREPFSRHKCKHFLNQRSIWMYLLLRIRRLRAQGSWIWKKYTFLWWSRLLSATLLLRVMVGMSKGFKVSYWPGPGMYFLRRESLKGPPICNFFWSQNSYLSPFAKAFSFLFFIKLTRQRISRWLWFMFINFDSKIFISIPKGRRSTTFGWGYVINRMASAKLLQWRTCCLFCYRIVQSWGRRTSVLTQMCWGCAWRCQGLRMCWELKWTFECQGNKFMQFYCRAVYYIWVSIFIFFYLKYRE